jgi:TetR/AcrR family transcriptional regulator
MDVRGDGSMIEKKKTRIKIRNEEKILEAALKLFAAYGLHGTTMEKIAELADMSQPNLHNYFKTKADLYEAVLNDILTVWVDPLGNLDVEGDPATELRLYIVKKVEMARKYPEASRIFAGEMLQGAPILMHHLKGQVRMKVKAFSTVIESWVRQGKIRPVDPVHLIFMIWASTQHYADFMPQIRAVMDVARLNKADYDAAADSICSIIIGGLTPP